MKKIAILTGLKSPEYEISIKSAKNIYDQIDKNKFSVYYFDLSIQLDDFLKIYKDLDLVIPVVHGIWWEDWQLTAFCKTLNIATLYSDHISLSKTIDKITWAAVMEFCKIKTPKTFVINKIEDIYDIKIDSKIFIKPANGGSSIDNWLFDNLNGAKNLISKILEYDNVIAQEYIRGKEFTVTVFDIDNIPKVAGVIEIISHNEFFDFEAKYQWLSKEICPAEITKELQKELEDISLHIYKIFWLKTISRIDLLVNESGIYCIDINTIPWWTNASLSPQSLRYYWYSDLTDFWTESINTVLNIK